MSDPASTSAAATAAAAAAATASTEPTSGLLAELRERSSVVAKRVADVQSQLMELEENYLDSTSARGNVLKGFETFLELRLSRMGAVAGLKKDPRRFKASDRVFSFSSTTAPLAKEDVARDEEAAVAGRWAAEYRRQCEEDDARPATSTQAQPPQQQQKQQEPQQQQQLQRGASPAPAPAPAPASGSGSSSNANANVPPPAATTAATTTTRAQTPTPAPVPPPAAAVATVPSTTAPTPTPPITTGNKRERTASPVAPVDRSASPPPAPPAPPPPAPPPPPGGRPKRTRKSCINKRFRQRKRYPVFAPFLTPRGRVRASPARH